MSRIDTFYYAYDELLTKAISAEATQDDLKMLATWFNRYDLDSWCDYGAQGYWECSGGWKLYEYMRPIEFNEDNEPEEWETYSYEMVKE